MPTQAELRSPAEEPLLGKGHQEVYVSAAPDGPEDANGALSDYDIDPALLNTGEDGLTTLEANQRLAEFGRNELASKAKSKWALLLSHFTGPMPCMIWTAILIELYIRDWSNSAVLIFLQLLNGLVGFHEDSKAGDAVAALKASLKPEAQVKRDGRWAKCNAAELVPGDRVALNAGTNVPADSQLCEGQAIEVDQAALTGESLPATFYTGEVAKMGSTVVRGEIDAIVVATGRHTFFGKTADMISSVDDIGHFQKILLQITMFLLVISLVLDAIALTRLLLGHESVLDSIAFAVVLLVASIPIAMQVVCTTTMALGSRTLALEGAIVARLSSIEQLAGMTMLCSDKTGTLTLNKMVLQEVCPYENGEDRATVLTAAALAAKWKEPAKDALDTLVLNAVDKEALNVYNQTSYAPFDPTRKRTEAVLIGPDGRKFRVMKGAPNIVLKHCTPQCRAAIGKEFESQVENLAMRGIRALAVARAFDDAADLESDGHENFVMMGILTFLDPPRPDTKRTIERAGEQGIAVKMVTGDHSAIAVETSRTLGMGTNILPPDKLPNFDTSGEIPKTLGRDYGELIEKADGFAQVFPEHKFLIVEALRQRNWSCGMTGDGVNDAPALKKADVGIAVEGSTDAAQAASDLVLTLPGLSVIVDAVIISRNIFQRMKNYVIYRVACTIQLLTFFFISVLFIVPTKFPQGGKDELDWPKYFSLPVIALVVITILNDGTIISIAYDNVIASPRPERWNLPILFTIATWLGFVAVASSMLLLYIGLESHDPTSLWRTFLGQEEVSFAQIQTMIYLKISLSDFLTVFAARTVGFFSERAPGKLLLGAAVLATLSSTILSCHWPFGTMEPIGGKHAVLVWLYCLLWFLVQDCAKVVLYKVLYHYDVSGIKTEDLACKERAEFLSTEARLGRLEKEFNDMKKMLMAGSNYEAVKIAANTGM